MKEASMLKELQAFLHEGRLLGLVLDPKTVWHTLDVLYETPRVERVWTQLSPERRLLVHRIHPCTKAFLHPHTWPSAVVVLDHEYTMRIGFGDPDGPEPPIAATLVLTTGSGYEMLDPRGWHDVSPNGKPSLSVMLTGRPWRPSVLSPEQKGMNRPLSDKTKFEILEASVFDARHGLV